jgi:hypothetical protein
MTTTAPAKPRRNALLRYVPILDWLPKYNRAWLAGDLVAGLSVWALMVAQALGYATISGVPVQYGLYGRRLPASSPYPAQSATGSQRANILVRSGMRTGLAR